MNAIKRLTRISLFVTLVLSGCQKDLKQNTSPTYIQEGNLMINTNQANFNSRIVYSNKTMLVNPIANEEKALSLGPNQMLNPNLAFTLVAQVAPPSFQGQTIEATHVKIYNNFAFVSYNTQNNYLGGVEVFDVSDIHNPKILWQAVANHVNFSSVDYYNGKLYLVGSTDINQVKTNLKSTAMLEVFSLDVNMDYVKTDTIIDLSSFVGTSVKIANNMIYTTSGTSGYLKVYNLSYKLLDSIPETNARSLDVNSSDLYVFNGPGPLNGSTAGVSDYNNTSFSLVGTYVTRGATQAQAESQMCATNNYIFTALNEGGIDILNLDGSIKQNIPQPAIPSGMPSGDYVSNAVSVNNNLVFIANGAAGLYVGGMINTSNDSLALIGTILFDDQSSSNYVVSQDSIIFVATGLGGLKILTISTNLGLPTGIIPVTVCNSLVSTINADFPEGINNMSKYPQLFSAVNKRVILTSTSNVYLTFLYESAQFRNSLGYYTYNINNPPTSTSQLQLHMLFPDVASTNDGGGLVTGDMVQIGSGQFPAGTVIGLYMVVQGWDSGLTVPGLYTDYTDQQFNNNNDQQSVLYIENNCGYLAINFKDVDLSSTSIYQDYDFNDAIFSFSSSTNPGDISAFDLTGIPGL